MSKSGILGFVDALFYIYYLLIFVRALFSWFRLPSRGSVYELFRFVYNVTEPYLGLFRRFMPRTAGIDFSPFIGMLTLLIIQKVVHRLIIGY